MHVTIFCHVEPWLSPHLCVERLILCHQNTNSNASHRVALQPPLFRPSLDTTRCIFAVETDSGDGLSHDEAITRSPVAKLDPQAHERHLMSNYADPCRPQDSLLCVLRARQQRTIKSIFKLPDLHSTMKFIFGCFTCRLALLAPWICEDICLVEAGRNRQSLGRQRHCDQRPLARLNQ